MQKFSEADNGNPDGTAKDRDGTTPGTYYKALYYNDNIFNLFEFVESQGYTLIADDLSQITKAAKGLYNSDFTYNTSAIATQSVSDIVRGSDGNYYEAQSDGFSGDDPVGSVSGNWKQVNFDNTPNDTRLFSIAGGTANAITVIIVPIIEYKDNSVFMFKASNDNTGATTINVNSLGVKNIVIDNVALSGGEIVNGNEYFVRYNLSNDNFELISLNDSNAQLPSVTGTFTATNSTNNINLTGVGLLDGLEIGDVIRITGSTSNDGEFTVEVITDADNVIVNQAHAGGTTTKALVNETSTSNVTVEILSKWHNAPLGLGQGWVNLIASRSAGVTYANTKGRSIMIAITATDTANNYAGLLLNIDGSNIVEQKSQASSASPYQSITAIVPDGSTYSVTTTTADTISIWKELR